MVALAFNPSITTVGAGLFAGPSTDGVVQGTAYPDPATRFALRTGILSAAETLPMWGGVGVYEFVPSSSVSGPLPSLGVTVGRATAAAGAYPLAGFSVFDQAYGMLNTPQSPVPQAGSGMQVMTYALGSRARIAVAADPGLINAQGGPIGAGFAWDYTNQLALPVSGAVTVSSGTYATATGASTVTLASAPTFSVGSSFTLSALAGTGAFASLNGTWTATAIAGNVVSFNAPSGLGATTITGGSLTTGPALVGPTILSFMPNNCLTVVWNNVTNTLTWNYNGAAAVIQI
jgi:hypothetical protein